MTVPTEDLLPVYWHADLDELGLSRYARRLAVYLRRRVGEDDREVVTNFNAWKKHLRMGHARLMQAVRELHEGALLEIHEAEESDRTVFEVSEELFDKCFLAREIDELELDVGTLSIYLRVARRVSRARPGEYGYCNEAVANIGRAAGLAVGRTTDRTGQGWGKTATKNSLRKLERAGLVWRGASRPGRTTKYHCRTNRQWSQWKEEMEAARRLEEFGLLSLRVQEPTSPRHFAVRTKAVRAASESTEQALERASLDSFGRLARSPDGDGASPEGDWGSPERNSRSPEKDGAPPQSDAEVNPIKINPSPVNPREVDLSKVTTASPPAAAGPASPAGSASPTTPGGSPVAPTRFAYTPSPNPNPNPNPNPSFNTEELEDVRYIARNSKRIVAYSLEDARELEDPQERFWAIYEVRIRDEFGVDVRANRQEERKVAREFEERGAAFMLAALKWFFDNWTELKVADSFLYELDTFPPVRAFHSEFHLLRNRAYISRDQPFRGRRRRSEGKCNGNRVAGRQDSSLDRADDAMLASESEERRLSRPDLPFLEADLEPQPEAPIRSAVEAYNAHRGDQFPEATSLRPDNVRRLRALVDKHGEENALEIVRDRTREAAEHRNSFVRLHGLDFLVGLLDRDLPSAA